LRNLKFKKKPKKPKKPKRTKKNQKEPKRTILKYKYFSMVLFNSKLNIKNDN